MAPAPAASLAAHAPPAGIQAQVRAFILDRITRGEWRVGARTPSEHELVAQFGCSRMTVHHAVKALSSEGYLTRRKGVGTFVAPPRAHVFEAKLLDTAEDVRARGHVHASQVLLRHIQPASAEEAARFGVGGGQDLLHARVLHLEDGVPLMIEDRLINPLLAPGAADLDPASETYFSFLMRTFPYPAGRCTIAAVAADAPTAALLALQPGEPCLQVERLTQAGERVLTTARLIYPASRYSIAGEFAPPAARQAETSE